jgi:hypothetical protein
VPVPPPAVPTGVAGVVCTLVFDVDFDELTALFVITDDVFELIELDADGPKAGGSWLTLGPPF